MGTNTEKVLPVVVVWLENLLDDEEDDPNFDGLDDADRKICSEWISRVREAVNAGDDGSKEPDRDRSNRRTRFCQRHKPCPFQEEAKAGGSAAFDQEPRAVGGMDPGVAPGTPVPNPPDTNTGSLRLRVKCSQAVQDALHEYGRSVHEQRKYNKDLKGLEALSVAVAAHLFVSEKALQLETGREALFQPRPAATLGGSREGSKLVDLVQAHWSAFQDDFSHWSVEPLGAGCRLLVEAVLGRPAPEFPLHQKCGHGDLRRLIQPDVDAEVDDALSSGPLEVHRVMLFVDYWLRELSRLEGREEEKAVHPYFHPIEFPRCFSRVAAEYSNRDLLARVQNEMKPLQNTELSTGSLRGFLFYGPPGTGKTTIIVKLCRYLGFTLAHKGPVSPGELLGALQGEQENKVKSLLLRAKAVPWLPMAIVLDEIEGLVPDRSRKEAESRMGTLSIMLNMWPGDMPNNFIFAATNIKSMIDAAILRRFGRKHFVGLTTPEDRRCWQGWPQGADLSEVQEDLVQMTINFSGANMNDLVDQVALDVSDRQPTRSGITASAAEQAQVVHKYTRDDIAKCVRDVCEQQSVRLGKDFVPDLSKRCREFPFELTLFADWLLQDIRLQWTTGRIFADLKKGCIEVEYNEGAHDTKCSEEDEEIYDEDDEDGYSKQRGEIPTPHTEDEDLKHAKLWTRPEVMKHLSLKEGYGKGQKTVRTYKRMDQGAISRDALLQLLLKVASSRNMQGLKLVDWMSLRMQGKLKQEDCVEFLHQQIEELREYKRAMLVLVLDAAGVATDKGRLNEDDNPGTVVQGDLFTDMVQTSNVAKIQTGRGARTGECVVEEEFLVVVVAESEATASRFRTEGGWPRGWDDEVNKRLDDAKDETVACELCGKDFQENQETAENPCKWHGDKLFAYLKTWKEKGRNLTKEYPGGDPMSLEFLEGKEESVQPEFLYPGSEEPLEFQAEPTRTLSKPTWSDLARPGQLVQRIEPRKEAVEETVNEVKVNGIQWCKKHPYHERLMSYDEKRENMRWTCCGQNSRCQECPHALPEKHTRKGGPSEKEVEEVAKPKSSYCIRCGLSAEGASKATCKCSDHPFISRFDAREQWCNFCCTNVKQHVPGSEAAAIPGCRESESFCWLFAAGTETFSSERSKQLNTLVTRIHSLSKQILLHPGSCKLYMKRLRALKEWVLVKKRRGELPINNELQINSAVDEELRDDPTLAGAKHAIMQDLRQLSKRFRKCVLARPAPTREHEYICRHMNFLEFLPDAERDEWTKFGTELLQLLNHCRPCHKSLRLDFFCALFDPTLLDSEVSIFGWLAAVRAEFLESGQLKEHTQPEYPDRYKFLIFAASQQLREPMRQWRKTGANDCDLRCAMEFAEAAKKAAETDSSSKAAKAEAQFCLSAVLYSCWAYQVKPHQHVATLGEAAALLSEASELARDGRTIYRDNIEGARKWLGLLEGSRSWKDLIGGPDSLKQLPIEHKVMLGSVFATVTVNDENAEGDPRVKELGRLATRCAKEEPKVQNDLALKEAVDEAGGALGSVPAQKTRLMAPHPGRIFLPLRLEKLVWRWDWDAVSAVPWELPSPAECRGGGLL